MRFWRSIVDLADIEGFFVDFGAWNLRGGGGLLAAEAG